MRLQQVAMLSRRSLLGTLRQPSAWVPPIVFPLIFAALNSAAFARSTQLPGFPAVDSFLDFMLATTLMQGVVFGSMMGGTDMAVDIQDGFFDRLAASPVPRHSILVGRLAGGAALAGLQAVVFIGIFTLFGASVKGGVPAMVTLVVIAMILGVAVGGFPLTLALRTGSSEAVQATFPVPNSTQNSPPPRVVPYRCPPTTRTPPATAPAPSARAGRRHPDEQVSLTYQSRAVHQAS